MVGEKTDKDEIRLCIRLGNGYVGGMMSGWKDGEANVVVEWCPGFFFLGYWHCMEEGTLQQSLSSIFVTCSHRLPFIVKSLEVNRNKR